MTLLDSKAQMEVTGRKSKLCSRKVKLEAEAQGTRLPRIPEPNGDTIEKVAGLGVGAHIFIFLLSELYYGAFNVLIGFYILMVYNIIVHYSESSLPRRKARKSK